MKCPKCGAELTQGSKFCNNCGASFNSGENKKQKNTVAIVAIAVAVVAVLAVVIVLLTSKNSSDKTDDPTTSQSQTADDAKESNKKSSYDRNNYEDVVYAFIEATKEKNTEKFRNQYCSFLRDELNEISLEEQEGEITMFNCKISYEYDFPETETYPRENFKEKYAGKYDDEIDSLEQLKEVHVSYSKTVGDKVYDDVLIFTLGKEADGWGIIWIDS